MDSLPQWVETEHGYDSGDDDQNLYALVSEMAAGFCLPEFDLWAASLPHCGPSCSALSACCLKSEMRERRKLAIEALLANNHDAAFRHLERMQNRQREYKREQFLLPLAQTGDRANKQREKAGFQTAEQVLEERKPEWERWQQLANTKWAANPRLSVRDVAAQIAGPNEKAETIRRRIRKPD